MKMSIEADRIRQHAYALWEQEGKPEGRSVEYWLKAEQSLKQDHAQEPSEDDGPPVISYLNEQHRQQEQSDSLNDAVEETFPCSDPVAATSPAIVGSPKDEKPLTSRGRSGGQRGK